MTSQSQGIQQLLQAEKRAKDKLEEAKKRTGSMESTFSMDWRSMVSWDTYILHMHTGAFTQLHGLVPGGPETGANPRPEGGELALSVLLVRGIKLIMGSQDNLSTKIDEETAAKIQDLSNNYHKNRENMLGRLLGEVYNINPDIHPNYAYTL
ncbi:PREDICTED: V-type proton ATPase subunit G 3-like [Thamnophis sirtalis]|uniref:V-type proton ATPase subunit G 3-like n=1 Tax=Thamnophis sirtalis TaxID=35019 RepID=A0A6I9YQZ8_9SAUR|nr:PREDICTED: V-type proton ATPase subunit G 3-like [Thamnophis sirtalis]